MEQPQGYKDRDKISTTWLRYGFLGLNFTYHVIVNFELNNVETSLFCMYLENIVTALGYSLNDIPSISPDFCIHRIHLQDELVTYEEHQRRLNPN